MYIFLLYIYIHIYIYIHVFIYVNEVGGGTQVARVVWKARAGRFRSRGVSRGVSPPSDRAGFDQREIDRRAISRGVAITTASNTPVGDS